MDTSFLEPCTKSFSWRAGNNDGAWRKIDVDDLLRNPKEGMVNHNFIWKVAVKWNPSEYDDIPWEVYTGFTISADDYSTVWKLMCKFTDLNERDYEDALFNIRLIGVDLTSEGDRIINTSYKGG